MALSPIEDRYLSALTAAQFPDMPADEPAMPVEPGAMESDSEGMLLAAGPAGTVSDAGAAFGIYPGAGKRKQRSDIGERMVTGAPDFAAGALRGAATSALGIGGDIQKIGRFITALATDNQGGSLTDKLGRAAQTMSDPTFLPSSTDVSEGGYTIPGTSITLPGLPAAVPAGQGGMGMTPEQRQAAAEAGQVAGELVGDPVMFAKAGQLAVKAGKALSKAQTPSTIQPSGVSYATNQDGPFYRVSKAGDSAGQGVAGKGRLYPGTAIENRAGSGRPSVYGDAPGQANQELQLRLNPGNNAALRIAEEITPKVAGKPYDVNLKIEPSSLKKQSAVGVAYDLAARRSPGYDQAVFNAYLNDPEYGPLIRELGIKNYDELVQRSYQQLEKETVEQFNALPVSMSYHKGGEGNYLDSQEMLRDVHLHNHLFVYQGGDRHEFLNRVDDATGLNSNEMFRAVHDYFGHAIKGNAFGPIGEEVAWASHAQMYSPLARIAMSAETRGQNSFVNYTPINAELIAQMEDVRRAMVDAQRAKNTEKVEQYKQVLRELGGQWQYAQQASVALPPEMTKLDYTGGMPDYMRSIQKPEGQALPVEHYGKVPDMTTTDPRKYGTGAKGRERERLDAPNAKRERTFFYEAGGQPEAIVVSQAPYKYKGIAEGLYDFEKDPLNLRKLSRVRNTSPATAKYNANVLDEQSMLNDIERMIYERGFKGYVTGKPGNRVAVSFDPVPVERTR